jgi:hypothetical protein
VTLRFGVRTLVALAMATASACSLLGPDLDHLDAAYGQALPEAGPGRACVPARPPGEPEAGAGTGGDRSIVTVFTTLGLLAPDDPRGFDLDDAAPVPSQPLASIRRGTPAIPTAGSTTSSAPPCK